MWEKELSCFLCAKAAETVRPQWEMEKWECWKGRNLGEFGRGREEDLWELESLRCVIKGRNDRNIQEEFMIRKVRRLGWSPRAPQQASSFRLNDLESGM